MGMDIVCRVCETPEDLELIFKRENGSILRMLREVARVSVEEHDTLPKCICTSCISRLQNANEFILECGRTDYKWRNKNNHTNPGQESSTVSPKRIKKSPVHESKETDEILQAFYDDREDRYRSSGDVKIEPELNLFDHELHSVKHSEASDCDDEANYFDDSDCKDPTYTPDEKQLSEDDDEKIPKIEEKPIKRRKRRTTPKEPKPPKPPKERKPRVKVADTKGNEPIHPCPICQKMLTKRGLLAHMETHGERHVCQMCGKQYSQRTGLNRHIRHFHNQYRPHMCQVCGKGFPRVSALQLHAATHADVKKYSCDRCDRTFKTTHCLNIHRKIHGDGTLLCGTCGLTFNDIPTQLAHIRTHRDHQCSTCSKRFATEESLKIHEARHINEKIHNCEHCEATFRRICDLNEHLLTHPESKPHKCKVCGNAYRHRGGLYTHALVHKGGKLYKCELCPKRFMRKYTLNKHVIKHEMERLGKTMPTNDDDDEEEDGEEEEEEEETAIDVKATPTGVEGVWQPLAVAGERVAPVLRTGCLGNEEETADDTGCGVPNADPSVNSIERKPFI